MSNEQTDKMKEAKAFIAAYPWVARYINDLETAIAAEVKRSDKLAQALKEVKDWAEWEQDKFPWYKTIDAALSDWRTARGAK